jgi:hypothetical protein
MKKLREIVYRVRGVIKVLKLLKEIEVKESKSGIEIELRGVKVKIEGRVVEVEYDGVMMLEPKYLSMCLKAGKKTEEGRREVEEKIERLKWLVENEEKGDEEREYKEDRRDREEEGDKGRGSCGVPVRFL